MTRAWSGAEVEALVADDSTMLRCELAGAPYSKTEHRRRLGAGKLAGKIEHTAKTRGDAEGYDILSFEASGRERLIEVKTTKYGRETPFFVSGNELRVSEDCAALYHLYRLFAFRDSPRLFTLPGALSRTCKLEPRSFIATVA